MAKKKIKFALKLKEGVEARNLQELREAFDLNQIVAYFLDGKLETWLLDRYYEDLAEKINDLDKSDPELRRKLCEIFEVEYEEDALSIEEIEERNHRIRKLKEVTDDDDIIKNVDKVAFCQEELADLLDEGQKTIYLCGTDFHIPASKRGIRYIGVETKLDITKEEIKKYQANDIELIDLLEGYFDEFKEEVHERMEEYGYDENGNKIAGYAVSNDAPLAVHEPVASYGTNDTSEDEEDVVENEDEFDENETEEEEVRPGEKEIHVILNGKKITVPPREKGWGGAYHLVGEIEDEVIKEEDRDNENVIKYYIKINGKVVRGREEWQKTCAVIEEGDVIEFAYKFVE